MYQLSFPKGKSVNGYGELFAQLWLCSLALLCLLFLGWRINLRSGEASLDYVHFLCFRYDLQCVTSV